MKDEQRLSAHLRAGREGHTRAQHGEMAWREMQVRPDHRGFAGLGYVSCTRGSLSSFQKESPTPSYCRLYAPRS